MKLSLPFEKNRTSSLASWYSRKSSNKKQLVVDDSISPPSEAHSQLIVFDLGSIAVCVPIEPVNAPKAVVFGFRAPRSFRFDFGF